MNTPVSPKVTAGAVSGVIAAAVLSNISLITPGLFTGLGKWSGLVYGLVITIAITGAGWLKSDPLRDAGADGKDAQQAATAPVTAPPAPEAPVAPVAPATSFAPVQAKLDAITPTTEVTPVYDSTAPQG